jgi:hypothetical protein
MNNSPLVPAAENALVTEECLCGAGFAEARFPP